MRKLCTRLIAASCVAASAVACSDGGAVQPDAPSMLLTGLGAGPAVEMVTGSGHFTTAPPAFNPGLWRTFSMTAGKTADGSVFGTYNNLTHLEDGGVLKSHGTVTCFTIKGNKAWIGGMNPASDPPDVAWQVVDNGEGSGADPDQLGLQISAAVFGFGPGFAQQFCAETPDVIDLGPPRGLLPLSIVLFDIEAGNLQVKP